MSDAPARRGTMLVSLDVLSAGASLCATAGERRRNEALRRARYPFPREHVWAEVQRLIRGAGAQESLIVALAAPDNATTALQIFRRPAGASRGAAAAERAYDLEWALMWRLDPDRASKIARLAAG